MQFITSETGTIITFLIIIAITAFLAYFISKYLQRKIKEKSQENVDITSFVFLKHMIVATICFFGFGWALLLLPITRTFAHSMLAGAGATTLILGFASQQLFNNLISGVFLIINRSFKIGDTIEFHGNQGVVVEINLYSTVIKDEKGDRIVIPSSLILSDLVKIVQTS